MLAAPNGPSEAVMHKGLYNRRGEGRERKREETGSRGGEEKMGFGEIERTGTEKREMT